MILNDNKIYGKVWEVTPAQNGKYIDLQITTSEKNGSDYINSTWFPRAIGKAVNTLKNVKPKDRITITKSKFTNERRDTEEGKRSFFRFLILDAEIVTNENNNSTPPTKTKEDAANDAQVEDILPW